MKKAKKLIIINVFVLFIIALGYVICHYFSTPVLAQISEPSFGTPTQGPYILIWKQIL
jgi:hypothetical protein